MARPIKIGIDYFPEDTILSKSEKMLLKIAGLRGIGLINLLKKSIYGNEGYYMLLDGDQTMLFCFDYNLQEEEFFEIIESSLRFKVFDESIFRTYNVLTSKDIQERYLKACEKRKEMKICKQYVLTNNFYREDIEFYDVNEEIVNSEKTIINSEKTMDNLEKSTQRKENKIIGNKTIVEQSIPDGDRKDFQGKKEEDTKSVLSMFDNMYYEGEKTSKLTEKLQIQIAEFINEANEKNISIGAYLVNLMTNIDKDSSKYTAEHILSKDTLINSSIYKKATVV